MANGTPGVWERLWDFAQAHWMASLTPGEAGLRLGAALILAGLVGFEREARGRSAGLRTHMLVGLAASLFTLLSFEIFHWVRTLDDDAAASDPLRLLEAITAGVAFLAAGSIFRDSERVRGLTTGAGLWMAGAIGMACGQGQILLAALATLLALAVLRLIMLLE